MAEHDERIRVRVPSNLKRAVQESPTTISEACRAGMEMAVLGEEVVEAEVKNEVAVEVLESARSVLASIEDEFAVISDVAESVREHRVKLVHEVALANRARLNGADSELVTVADRVEEADLEWLERETILATPQSRVDPGHGKVRDVVPPGVTGEEIVALLKERNPDLPEWKFEKGGPHETVIDPLELERVRVLTDGGSDER